MKRVYNILELEKNTSSQTYNYWTSLFETGTWPYTCSRCGETFDTHEDLADPDQHNNI